MPRTTTGTVTVPTLALARALALVIHAAAKDEARPVLQSVLFQLRRKRGQPTVLRLIACDNYRIAWADIPDAEIGGTRKVDSWLMRLEDASLVGAMLGATKGGVTRAIDGSVAFVIDGSGEVTVGINGHAMRYPLRDGQYPNYEHVLTDSVPPRKRPNTVAFTGEYLAQVAKAFTAKPGKSHVSEQSPATLVLEWWDPLKPARVTTKGQDDHGEILMPVRI